MGITNEQYDAVMRVYDRRRMDNHHIDEDRRRTAYSRIPDLAGIDRAVALSAVENVRRALSPMSVHAAGGAAVPFRDLLKKAAGGEAPGEKRRRLLREHGFPEDYLDPVYTCPDCRDTGFIGTKHCHCFQKEVIRLFYTQSGLQDILQRENFDTFDLTYYPEDMIHPKSGRSSRAIMTAALASCRAFAADYGTGAQSDFLFLTGQTGAGKTFLTHCIAKELIDNGRSVIYYSAGELFDRMADARFTREGAAPEDRVDDEYLSGCDLLIIDDLGTELVNSFVGSSLFRLLNSRICAKRGMVISTNLSPQEISKTYSERISSRILESFTLIEVYGRDIRIQKRLRH